MIACKRVKAAGIGANAAENAAEQNYQNFQTCERLNF